MRSDCERTDLIFTFSIQGAGRIPYNPVGWVERASSGTSSVWTQAKPNIDMHVRKLGFVQGILDLWIVRNHSTQPTKEQYGRTHGSAPTDGPVCVGVDPRVDPGRDGTRPVQPGRGRVRSDCERTDLIFTKLVRSTHI